MIKYLLPVVFLIFAQVALAQINETFSDGDFTNAPAWIGNPGDWIVNSSEQLESNNTVANGIFYLSTANSLATNTEWEFYMRLAFNTSSRNYVDAFIIASFSDLTAMGNTGYFVRIGSTKDNVSFYRMDADGSITQLIAGATGITDKADNFLKIKVVRGTNNQFTLYCDATASGNSYVTEGVAIDNTYTTSAYFGFLVHQSTSSFFTKHFFDDIIVQPFEPANDFSLTQIDVVSATAMDLVFSHAVDLLISQSANNFSVNNSIGNPVAATVDALNPALVHLSFSTAFVPNTHYTLSLSDIRDASGNNLGNPVFDFSYDGAQRNEIVIDEIMADPNPVVSLPDAEFVELKNISGSDINLSGWTLSAGSKSSSSFGDFTLAADSFVILCSPIHSSQFEAYGQVLGVTGFPPIVNGGTFLVLKDEQGKTIHALNFRASWYQNPLKANGGWSLEMVDTHNPCGGMDNWKASTDASGGTPGRKNSVDAVHIDENTPALLRTYTTANNRITLLFNKPMDSSSLAGIANYIIDNALAVVAANPVAPLFDQVQITLDHAMEKQKVYAIQVANVRDCAGNSIGKFDQAKAGIPEDAAPNDIIINEILYDPKPDASDYVELFNSSPKIIDVSKLFLANRNSTNTLSSFKKISEVPFFLYPENYLALTDDTTSLHLNYLVKDPSAVLEMPALPAYPVDKGTVVVSDLQQNVIDEVAYSKDWQFALITDARGVALERVEPSGKSQEPTNWHSAASTAGYGTPGYRNSQFKKTPASAAQIIVAPKIFSPDNDGYEDITTISYNVGLPGYVANIIIFDGSGRQVRYLVKNNLLGIEGSWNWDGLDDNLQKLPVGTYIVFTEIFNLQGDKKQFRNAVVLARKN